MQTVACIQSLFSLFCDVHIYLDYAKLRGEILTSLATVKYNSLYFVVPYCCCQLQNAVTG